MQTRLFKEIRLLLPAWLITVLLTFSPALFKGMGSDWAVLFLAIGSAVMVACSFGPEFSYGTLVPLLAQPIERRRIWFEKLSAIGVVLLPLIVAALAVYFGTMPKPTYWLLLVIPVCAVCSTPFFTFLTRNTVGAVVLSAAAPFFIFLGGGALVLWLLKTNAVAGNPSLEEAIDEGKLHRYLFWYFGVVLPLYCGVLYGAGYRSFLRLEVANMVDRQIRLGTFLHLGFERFLGGIFPGKRRCLALLLGKELRLHQHTLTLFVIFTAIQIAAVAFILVAKPISHESYFILPLMIYAILVPLAVGASAFAEEEKIGIRALQLTVPLSLRAQWFVKIAVAFSIVALLGSGVTWAWVLIAKHIGPLRIPPQEFLTPESVPAIFLYQVFAVSIGLYTSSLSRDTLRAILAAVGCMVGLSLIVAVIGFVTTWIAQLSHNPLRSLAALLDQNTLLKLINRVQDSMPWLVGIGWGLLPAIASFWNFRTVDRSPQRVWSNAFGTFVPAVLLSFFLVNIERTLWLVYTFGK